MPQVASVMIIVVGCLSFATSAEASSRKDFWDCLSDIEQISGVDRHYFLSIKLVESGRQLTPVVRHNTNKTEDIGIMQINSLWLPTLLRHGISRDMLLNNCTNLRVAAWILLKHLRVSNGNIWEAVGRYHSTTPHLKQAYIDRVQVAFRQLRRES